MSSCPALGTTGGATGGPITDGRFRFYLAPALPLGEESARAPRGPRSQVKARRQADANCPQRGRPGGILGDRLGGSDPAHTCRSGTGAVWPAGGAGRARLGNQRPGSDPVRPTPARPNRSTRRYGRRFVGSTGGGSRSGGPGSGACAEANNHQDYAVRQGHPMTAAPGIRGLLTPQTLRKLLLQLPGGHVSPGRPAASPDPRSAVSPVRRTALTRSSPGGLRWPT